MVISKRKIASDITIDIEKQKEIQHFEACEEKTKYITTLQLLFGCSTEQLHRLPGATAWCQYLENSFEAILNDHYAFIWTTIGLPRPTSTVDCWPWFEAVTTSILQCKGASTSIEDIWDLVRVSATVANTVTPRKSDGGKSACLIAIFAVLCWSSMTLQPKLTWPDNATPSHLAVQHLHPDHSNLKMDFVHRPLSAVFRSFQRSKALNRWRPPISTTGNDTSTILYVSTLNFSSLRIIGKLRLEWVDNINSHLEFDSRSRTLCLFRFPSFCALTTMRQNKGIVFEELSRALYSTDSEACTREYECNLQLSQEVLMSYRVLFGQTRSSRKLAIRLLHELSQKCHSEYDQLLDIICGKPCKEVVKVVPTSLWPISCRGYDDFLQEEDSYSSHDDFPMFGQRLAAIQEFNLRQQPSKLRDLWRDRRHPLQWYTFWAVLVVGGASVVLALLQLIVAIIAIPVSPPCDCRHV